MHIRSFVALHGETFLKSQEITSLEKIFIFRGEKLNFRKKNPLRKLQKSSA